MGLINKRQVRNFFRSNDIRISSEAHERIENKVKKMLTEAKERAIKNKRTTVMEVDF